jgi:glycosyltransferase involved in cell wall biosynthesis
MSAASPLISILVPAYNTALYLPELCRSLQAQTLGNFEALIFDDGSADNLAEAFSPFAGDARFQLAGWKQNRGLNAAWRELLGRMRGKFWVSPGADDVLLPEFLERRVALLEANPNAVLVHGAAVTIDETGREIPNPFPKLNLPSQMDGRRALGVLLQHNIINQPSALVRADVTRNLLPQFRFDWKFAPDWHLWLLHAAAGGDFLWDSTPLHKYRIHGRSLSCNPAQSAIRRAETRLVPLCALSAAASLSPAAADAWKRWRKTLYQLWLLRALKLRFQGMLKDDWLHAAGEAYHGAAGGNRNFPVEFWRQAPGIVLSAWKERRAWKTQSFQVSGLAQINDPVFR